MLKKEDFNFVDREVLSGQFENCFKFKFKNYSFFRKSLMKIEFYNIEIGWKDDVRELSKRLISEDDLKYYFDQIFVFYFKYIEYTNYSMDELWDRLFQNDLKLTIPLLILFTNKDYLKFNTFINKPFFCEMGLTYKVKKLSKDERLNDRFNFSENHSSLKIKLPNYLYKLDLIFVFEFESKEEFFKELVEIRNIDLIHTYE